MNPQLTKNQFGESENEADQYSPGEPSSGLPIALGPGKGKLYMWTDPYVNPALQQQGQQSSMGEQSKTKPKWRSAQKEKATFKMWKKCKGAKGDEATQESTHERLKPASVQRIKDFAS